jgi:hypothetical protein
MEDTLRELLERTEKYDGPGYWEKYKENYFMKLPADQRVAELAGWDRLLEKEVQPSRETADLITRRREIGALDSLLRRAGR